MPINGFLYPGAKTTPAYEVANSVRYNDGDSPKMERTTSAGSNTIGTFSCWVKRGALGTDQAIFTSTNDTVWFKIWFHNEDYLRIDRFTGSAFTLLKITDKKFRDTSSWYHIHIALDTTNGTAEDRMILTVNGTRVTSFASSTNSGSSDDLIIGTNTYKHRIGANQTSGDFFDGYLSEVVWIDGTALAVTNFGEFDEDSPTIWKPKNVSGLTFGTNGFYLDFEDSSALGNDVSGNDNDFTPTNLAATDQSTDTCTNNFCTMNPLDNYYAGATFSEGNLKFVHGSSAWCYNTATFGLSSGKWYWEMKCVDAGSGGGGDQPTIGIANKPPTSNANYLGQDAYAWGYRAYPTQRNVINNGAEVLGSLSQFTDGDIIGVYMDLDNNKLYFSKNGTLENSTGISLTAPSSTPTGVYFPAAGDNTSSASATWETNFGSPSFSISSGNTDDNGYGNFEYSPNITGDSTAKKFYACNTKNLAEFG